MTQGITVANMPPDPEIIFRQWLLDQTTVTDLVGTRVATRLPVEPTLPFVVITALGNVPTNPGSQVALNDADITIDCFAGRWGGDGTKAEPDYATASNLAQVIYQALFKVGSSYVTTSGGTKAKIYGFEVTNAPVRIEESEVLVANFNVGCTMTYRYSE